MGIKKKIQAVQLSKVDKPIAKAVRESRSKRVLRWVKKSLAYIVLVLSSAYGFRMLLQNVQPMYAVALTGIVMVLLVTAIAED